MYIISAILGIAAVLLTEVGGYYAAIIIALIITAVVFRCEKDRYFERSLIINLS